EALISDESGSVKAIWFNQPYLAKTLFVGETISLAGKTSDNFFDLQLLNPAYEKIREGIDQLHTGRLVPIYHLGEKISQRQFRTLIKNVLDTISTSITEWLPRSIFEKEDLLPLQTALTCIHFPQSREQFEKATTRFKFDELFFLQMFNRKLKRQLQSMSAPEVSLDYKNMKTFLACLPFQLTEGQKQAMRDILADIQKKIPMNRLLEGDVGSGKTIVAALTAMNIVHSGHQVAFMAPTEILAKQHFGTLCQLFGIFDVRIGLMTRSTCSITMKKPHIRGEHEEISKKQLLSRISEGTVDIIVGTHALLENPVQFHSLGLAIIDEQHRFGVKQRKALRLKNNWGLTPHLLSMTATPIPRTLALTVYGDLDISIIDTMPVGRKNIITKIVPMRYRDWTYDFIRKQVKKGRQVFVICALIDPSDMLGARSVKQEYERLTKEIFPDLRIGMLHGKMKADEKERTMSEMLEKNIDILISTSVIEVGVDIPNATVMLIEGAERFGLAQLHQFRGRVGRSSYQSYCFLLPTEQSQEEKERLKVFVTCNNGFELAEKDLQFRGSGDMYGQRQSGMAVLKIASLNDVVLIKKAREWAEKISEEIEKYPEIERRVEEFQKEVHLE
ncbi:MAG: ATP-dependent DNA helicase RecG, partial [bacterium]|nr:ATP-dependent DNA helicase RecG [bacterium]